MRFGRNNRPRRPQNSSQGKDPYDMDYGFGYSDEGRPITGIEGQDLDDPNAPIEDEKGEVITVDLAKKKPFARLCAPEDHDMQPEGDVGDEIKGAQAMKCSRCPYGTYVRQE